MDKHEAYCYGLAIGFALKVAAKHDLSTESGRDAFRIEIGAEMDKDDSPYIKDRADYLLKGILDATYQG
jgi:hypothetical protein